MKQPELMDGWVYKGVGKLAPEVQCYNAGRELVVRHASSMAVLALLFACTMNSNRRSIR